MKQLLFPLLMTLGTSLAGCALLPGEPPTSSPAPKAEATTPAPAKPAEKPAQPAVAQPPVEKPAPTPAPAATTPARRTVPTEALPVIQPGECWVQAVIHPRPVRKPLDIVVRDAVNDISVTPAEIEPVWQKVTVREGGVTYRIEPPVYKRVTEQVVVRPEVRRTIVVPAVYEEKESTIELEAERTVLERCKVSSAARSADMPVQSLCSRLIPAKTRTIKRKMLVQPETTREEVEPAVYKEITRWVIETPARAVPVDIKPQMGSMRVKEITEPERIEEEQLPPEIRHFVATEYEGTPAIVFRRALCDPEVSPELIQSLQAALKQAGFDPGATDGKLGKRTFAALLDYQRQNGLAHGALTHESLEHLGLKAAP